MRSDVSSDCAGAIGNIVALIRACGAARVFPRRLWCLSAPASVGTAPALCPLPHRAIRVSLTLLQRLLGHDYPVGSTLRTSLSPACASLAPGGSPAAVQTQNGHSRAAAVGATPASPSGAAQRVCSVCAGMRSMQAQLRRKWHFLCAEEGRHTFSFLVFE